MGYFPGYCVCYRQVAEGSRYGPGGVHGNRAVIAVDAVATHPAGEGGIGIGRRGERDQGSGCVGRRARVAGPNEGSRGGDDISCPGS